MAIVGSLESGLTGNHQTLFAKSVLDGVTSIIFASTMGLGVIFSAVAVFLYQGAITLTAVFMKSFLVPSTIQVMTPTARYADLLLPATTFLENRDLYTAYGHFHLGVVDPVIPPQGEAISNFDLFQTLARKMGFAEAPFRQTVDAASPDFCRIWKVCRRISQPLDQPPEPGCNRPVAGGTAVCSPVTTGDSSSPPITARRSHPSPA